MIKTRHTFWGRHFWGNYFLHIIGRHFRSVPVEIPELDSQRPLIALGNHYSWWDGFLVYYLNHYYWKRKLHIMMLEEELEKRKFLRSAGAFSVKKSSRSVVLTIRYVHELLKSAENVVALFPQGKIESMHAGSIRFEKGVIRILDQNPHAQVLFFVSLTDYGSNPKETLSVFHQLGDYTSAKTFEDQYNDFYRACLDRVIDVLPASETSSPLKK